MADITKSTYQIKLNIMFADGDTRIVSLDNPQTNLTQQLIKAIESSLSPVLIGDKNSGTFSAISAAKYVQTSEITVDLNS